MFVFSLKVNAQYEDFIPKKDTVITTYKKNNQISDSENWDEKHILTVEVKSDTISYSVDSFFLEDDIISSKIKVKAVNDVPLVPIIMEEKYGNGKMKISTCKDFDHCNDKCYNKSNKIIDCREIFTDDKRLQESIKVDMK